MPEFICEETFMSPSYDDEGSLCDECGEGYCYLVDEPEDCEDDE